jgi:hypothetical protein
MHRLGIAAVWSHFISFHLRSIRPCLRASIFSSRRFRSGYIRLCDTETLQHGFYDVFHRLLHLTFLDSDNAVIRKAFGNQNQMRKTDLNLWSWSALQSCSTSPSSSSTQPCRRQETKSTSIEEHLHRRSLDSEKKGAIDVIIGRLICDEKVTHNSASSKRHSRCHDFVASFFTGARAIDRVFAFLNISPRGTKTSCLHLKRCPMRL